jgi:hypothetical protein
MHTFHSLNKENSFGTYLPLANDSYIQQRKCSHGFKNRNNRELKNNRDSTIHSDRHIINTHLGQCSSVIFIQLKLTYIRCSSPLLNLYKIDSKGCSVLLYPQQQQLLSTQLTTTPTGQYYKALIQRGTLRAFPPTTLCYLNGIKCYQLLNAYYNKYCVRQIRAQAPNLYCDTIHKTKYIPPSSFMMVQPSNI